MRPLLWLSAGFAALALAGPNCVRHERITPLLEDRRGQATPPVTDPPRPTPGQEARGVFGPAPAATARGRYWQRLVRAELDHTQQARQWQARGEAVLEQPEPAKPPLRELVHFDPSRPEAVAYVLSLVRGRRLLLNIDDVGDNAGDGPLEGLFVDLRAQSQDGTDDHVVASIRGDALDVPIEKTGTYLLRVQPQLYVGGRLRVKMATAPSLTFPVEGHGPGAVQSRFGAPRDGGRRQHHGVDIFAPRGTPALAAGDGIVARVSQSRLGGNVVWVRERDRKLALYYAHLDRQLVELGQRVQAGDVLGTIGNSGNARYTKPHLHFGIYRYGPIDPYPFVRPEQRNAAPVRADPAHLGRPLRLIARRRALRSGPGRGGEILDRLPRGTLVTPTAARGRWYRVRLPDDTEGYLRSRWVRPITKPIRVRMAGGAMTLRAAPVQDAETVTELAPGERFAVLGRFDGHLWIEDSRGVRGWALRDEDHERGRAAPEGSAAAGG